VVAVAEPSARNSSILTITMVGGLASSIFIPLTGYLAHTYGWRAALVVLAGLVATTTVPLHLLAVPRRPRQPRAGVPHAKSAARVLRDPGFWLLAGAFVVHSAGLAVISVHLVLYLVSLGHPPARAASLAGLLGLLSVTGRLVASVSARWLPMATITALIMLGQGAAVALLPAVGMHVGGAIGCLVLFGLGFGVSSVAMPAILLDRYGATGFGTIAGMIGTPATIAKAVGPLGAAWLAEAFGYRPLMFTVAVGCVSAAVALALSRRLAAPASTTM
jgi:predicted MFS family arabinose efflux permease